MPVGAMCEQMTAYELMVEWPAFFRARRLLREDLENSAPGGDQ